MDNQLDPLVNFDPSAKTVRVDIRGTLSRASRPDLLQEIQRIRFEARINFIREFMSEEQLQQMQRSRSIG